MGARIVSIDDVFVDITLSGHEILLVDRLNTDGFAVLNIKERAELNGRDPLKEFQLFCKSIGKTVGPTALDSDYELKLHTDGNFRNPPPLSLIYVERQSEEGSASTLAKGLDVYTDLQKDPYLFERFQDNVMGHFSKEHKSVRYPLFSDHQGRKIVHLAHQDDLIGVSTEDLLRLRATLDPNTIFVELHAGHGLVVNNSSMFHGRSPRGPERRPGDPGRLVYVNLVMNIENEPYFEITRGFVPPTTNGGYKA